MKVPFTSIQNSSKLGVTNYSSNNNNSFQGGATVPVNLCYEPKSVLELQHSPRPIITEKPIPRDQNTDINNSVAWDESLQLEEDHVLNHLEDWDSLMKDFGLHEESNSNPSSKPLTNISQLVHPDSHTHFLTLSEFLPGQSFESAQFAQSDFPLSDLSSYHNQSVDTFDLATDDATGHGHVHDTNNWNLGYDYVDELIRLAECFETNSLNLSHVILGRLNQRLRSATGKPLQRAAFYFKEALQTLLTGSTRPTRPSSSDHVIQSIKAHKAFSNISPLPMFSSFTANQAVLEALDGSMIIHVIDFDIGLGGHWASFLKELADKAETRKTSPPFLRISAVVGEEYAMETMLIRDNLTEFARELHIGFGIDFVLMATFELLSFKAMKFMEGEKVAILLSPAIFRRVGNGFLSGLRRVSPHVVVHLDSEGLMGFGTATLRQTVIDGLEFYSTIMESLEAANGGGGAGGEEWMRKIENFVMFPKILEVVGSVAGRRGTPWREAFVAAGLRPVGLSQFADFQAECLIRRVQVRGFHVARRQAEMLLCWHERPLVATSAWRF